MKAKFFAFFLLISLSLHEESLFSNELNELDEAESMIGPQKKPEKKLTKMDLQNPEVMGKLEKEIEKQAMSMSNGKNKNKKSRKLQLPVNLKSMLNPPNKLAFTFGNLLKPITEFAGVQSDTSRDVINTGYGLGTAFLGNYNNRHRERKFTNMNAILENKYHLNDLFIKSIQEQNSNNFLSQKMLERIETKVTRTRKTVLAKVHAVINPLS